VLSRVRRCSTRTPRSCCRPSRDGRRSTSPAIEPGPPRSQRRRRKPGQLATQAPLPGLCAAIVLAGLAGAPPAVIRRGGAPGEGWPSARGSWPGSGQAATLSLATVASHPGSLQPGISPGCEARLTGLARAPTGPLTTARVPRVPAVNLSWTWPRNSRPPADLTPPAAGSPGSRPGPGRCPQGQVTARSTRGRCQAGGRSAGGRPGVCRRYTPGQWWLAAWASAPVRYP
jgi:hypothetical protein